MPAGDPHGPASAPAARRAGWLLLLVVGGGVGVRLAVVHPLHDYLLDFRGYYAAGRALDCGVDPYDPRAIADGVPLPGEQAVVQYLYPPHTLALMWWAARLPYAAGQVAWCVGQYVLVLFSIGLVLRALRCPVAAPCGVLVAVTFLLSVPVAELFRWGQFDGVVLALMALAFFALARDRASPAGLALGAAAAAKVTPIVYLLVLLARGKWKAAAAGAALAGVFFAFGAAAFGPALSLEWCGVLRAAGSAPATLASPHNMSIAGFVRRALAAQSGIGASETVPAGASTELATILTGVGVALVTGLTALWLVRCRARLGPAECLAGVVPAVLLSAPVTWPHHAVLLLIPLAVAANTALNVPRPRVSDAAWLVAAMLLMTNWPVEQFDLQLPARLSALAGPTTFYAAVLLWSFLLVRSRRAVRVGNSALAADKHSALVPVPTAAARAGAVAEVARP